MPTSNPSETQPSAVSIVADVMHAPATQMRPQPPHEWQTPDGELNIVVNESQGGSLIWTRGGNIDIPRSMGWYGNSGNLKGLISSVRKAAEEFRATAENYLNNIDRDDLVVKLKEFASTPHKLVTDYSLAPEHQAEWDTIARCDELRKVAFFGYALYQTLFPEDTGLRSHVDAELKPGWRVNLQWCDSAHVEVPHIPWGLLYQAKLPPPGEPLEAMNFWGLRYRIGYVAHNPKGEDKSLGNLDETYRGCCLYWGDRQEDATAQEARWQQAAWTDLTKQVFVPKAGETTRYKEELKSLLANPQPSPMRFLYLFCHCDVGSDGATPILRFGSTKQPTDIIEQMDLGQDEWTERPLVFVNACTSAGGTYVANELEQTFFRRGCRAYIGTETKVPIQFASRFAYIFCQFFYRRMDEKPIAAGEAIYQTRQFLWHQYRNIGGLFYTYINQYDLYMAREDEVKGLRR